MLVTSQKQKRQTNRLQREEKQKQKQKIMYNTAHRTSKMSNSKTRHHIFETVALDSKKNYSRNMGGNMHYSPPTIVHIQIFYLICWFRHLHLIFFSLFCVHIFIFCSCCFDVLHTKFHLIRSHSHTFTFQLVSLFYFFFFFFISFSHS